MPKVVPVLRQYDVDPVKRHGIPCCVRRVSLIIWSLERQNQYSLRHRTGLLPDFTRENWRRFETNGGAGIFSVFLFTLLEKKKPVNDIISFLIAQISFLRGMLQRYSPRGLRLIEFTAPEHWGQQVIELRVGLIHSGGMASGW